MKGFIEVSKTYYLEEEYTDKDGFPRTQGRWHTPEHKTMVNISHIVCFMADTCGCHIDLSTGDYISVLESPLIIAHSIEKAIS